MALSKYILAIVCLTTVLPLMAEGAVDNCITCHREIEDPDGPAHRFSRDIHFQRGLGCVDCHGGDPTLDDMDDVRRVKGYRGVPDHFAIPQFCADCHSNVAYMRNHNPALPTDQLEKYKTSVHGRLLFEKKDPKVANCVSCHSSHEIGDARLPHSTTHPLNLPKTCAQCHSDAAYMQEYNIPTNQYDDYMESVHADALFKKRDLGAPACNDCHGNHGAAPPGVESLSAVCGVCHAFQFELFAASPHMQAFKENDFPMCETCHSNHKILSPGDTLIGTKEPALCADCHSADDGTKGFETAAGMLTAINRLAAAHNAADSVLKEAMLRGMMTTDEEIRLKEVDQALIQTRTTVHAFDLEVLLPIAADGVALADSVRINSASLIDEYYYRRKGLALATLFITIAAIALYLKIRRLHS